MAIYSTPGSTRGPAYTKTGPNSGNWSNIDRTASNPLWQAWGQSYNNPSGGTPGTQAGEDPQVTAAKIAADAQAATDRANAQLAAQQREYEKQQRYNATTGLLKGMFSAYGLESLFSQVEAWARMDLTADEIIVNLRKTPEYKNRFPAMDTLMKDGRAISEAEYMAYEENARQVEKLYGLPTGMVSGKDAVAKLLIKSVSGKELESRVVMSANSAYNTPPEFRETMKNYYGVDSGGLTAYFLDPDRAMPMLQKQYVSAQIGTEALMQDIGVAASMAEGLYTAGIDQSEARQGFQQVGQRTGLMYGKGDKVGQDDLVMGTFGLDAKATADIGRVASSRVGRFEGGGQFSQSKSGVSGIGSASS